MDTEKDAQNRANNYLVFIFGKDDNVSFDEEVEKEFNKLVDKLKLENNKLLEELNKLENK